MRISDLCLAAMEREIQEKCTEYLDNILGAGGKKTDITVVSNCVY